MGTNERPKISVIIATSNNAEHIGECLDSIFSQTMDEFEIITVDVNSTDGTKDILMKEAQDDGRMVFLADSFGSLGHAKNIGLSHARAPYVLFMGSEDYIERDALELLCREMEENPQDNFIAIDVEGFGDDSYGRTGMDRKKAFRDACEKDGRKFSMESRLFRRAMFDCAVVYRMSFLMDKGIRFYEVPGYGKQDAAFRFLALARGRSMLSAAARYYHRMDIPKDTLHDQKAVADVCREFIFLREKLKENPADWQMLRYVFWQSYYTENMELYEKLSLDLRPILSQRMQGDILQAIRSGELSKEYFDITVREEMELLLQSADAFDDFQQNRMRQRRKARDAYNERDRRVAYIKTEAEEQEAAYLDGEESPEKRTRPLNRRWLLNEMARDLAPLRLLLGIGADEMGAMIGVSEQTYKGMESGRREVSWDQYMALLFVFRYNRRTSAVIDTLGLYPKALQDRLREGILYTHG